MDIVSQHPYAVVVTIGDVKADLTLLRAVPKRIVYSLSDEMIGGVQKYYNEVDTSMNSHINALYDRYLADKTNVPALENKYNELVQKQKELIALAKVEGTKSMNILLL